jgi:hypothetical protein
MMNGILKLAFYVVVALVVVYLWMHFEAPKWNPFRH